MGAQGSPATVQCTLASRTSLHPEGHPGVSLECRWGPKGLHGCPREPGYSTVHTGLKDQPASRGSPWCLSRMPLGTQGAPWVPKGARLQYSAHWPQGPACIQRVTLVSLSNAVGDPRGSMGAQGSPATVQCTLASRTSLHPE